MTAGPILTWKEADERIAALEAECAALKAEVAALPNYGTASNHSVWALQRDRIRELETRIAELLDEIEQCGGGIHLRTVERAKKEAP
jgi:uncharacterized small protein (DUF1192 family)